LARQALLAREQVSVESLLERLAGMQAQIPHSPYVGLWSRIEGFEPEDLSSLLTERRAVRIALMRSTIHLVTAADSFALRPVVQPAIGREIINNKAWSPGLEGVDFAQLREAARTLLETSAMTPAALGQALAVQWPRHHPASLAHAARTVLPLVQVPPRGLWGRSGQTKLTTAEAWLGRDGGPGLTREELILRYLAAFGPASVADVQSWSGLQGLRDPMDALRPQLLTFRDERNRELFDLPEGPRPGEGLPAPIRFLPEYDNLLLSHSDRARVITEQHRTEVVRDFGARFFLVDGFVAGRWKPDIGKSAATLTIDLFESASAARAEVAAEAERVAAFLAPRVAWTLEFGPVVLTRQR
jgi:hypothetical protein